MSNIINVPQEPLYLVNDSTTINYTNRDFSDDGYVEIDIAGGSGTGALHYSIENITGKGSINSNGEFVFERYGIVHVLVYKDGSPFTRVQNGQTVQCYYERSKTLVVRLELTQTQLYVRVNFDMHRNVGDPRPEIPEPDDHNTSPYIVDYTGVPISHPKLSISPVIYFVNDSDDYYKFDVFHKVYEDTRKEGGIIYRREPNGSWTVDGRSTGSYYNLIVSESELPTYLVRGRDYKIVRYGNIVRLRLEWYNDGILISSDTVTGSQIITVPSNATGFKMQFYIPSGTNVSNYNFTYRMYDNYERSIVSDRIDKYAISAKNASVYNEGFKDTILYRSRWLYFDNTQEYRVYIDQDGPGIASADFRAAKPYTLVCINVKAQIDGYYRDNWDNRYDPMNSSRSIYDSLWDNVSSYKGQTLTNKDVTLGITDLSIIDSGMVIRDSNYELVPFHRLDGTQEFDRDNHLISASYIFVMPSTYVTISCIFGSLSASDGSTPYYGRYPYADVGYGSSYRLEIKDKRYRDALSFCFWARQYYFNEDMNTGIPLMRGVKELSGGLWQFYGIYEGQQYTSSTYPATGDIIHRLARRDLVDVLSRVSHVIKYTQDSSITESQACVYPDRYEYQKGLYTNTPVHHLYTYAGYEKSQSDYNTPVDPSIDYSPMPNHWNSTIGGYISEYFSPAADLQAYAGGGADDDYKLSVKYMNNMAWNTWVGNVTGFDDFSFSPMGYATFQEALTILWRYAQFRQFDVITHGAPNEVDDSEYASWAQHGPLRWALSKGIITGYRVPLYDHDMGRYVYSDTSTQPLIQPTDYIDRIEWAYMMYNFCRLYAW